MNWKKIPRYPYYEVSSDGRVRSIDRVVKKVYYRGVELKPQLTRDGYLRVKLSDIHGNRKHKKIHILVAQCHKEGYYQGCDIDHLNRDKKNNSVDNLEITSHEDNMRRWMVQDEIIKPIVNYEYF